MITRRLCPLARVCGVSGWLQSVVLLLCFTEAHGKFTPPPSILNQIWLVCPALANCVSRKGTCYREMGALGGRVRCDLFSCHDYSYYENSRTWNHHLLGLEHGEPEPCLNLESTFHEVRIIYWHLTSPLFGSCCFRSFLIDKPHWYILLILPTIIINAILDTC